MEFDVVVIAGITGSGKSTLAEKLAASQSWEFIEADDFHDATAVNKMRSGIPLCDEDRLPWLLRLNQKLHEPPYPAVESRVPRVLSCSALKSQYRNILSDGLKVCFVWLDISEELARERTAGRAGHFMPSSLVQSQLDIAEAPEHALVLDAARPLRALLGETLRFLGATTD